MSSGTSEVPTNSTEGGDTMNYTELALIVGVPCGVIITILLCLICITFCLIFTSTGHVPRETEEKYMQQRFQKGLSLKEQREMSNRKSKKKRHKKKQLFDRKESSLQVPESASSIQPSSRPPHGLHEEWMRLSRSSRASGETETDIDNDDSEMVLRRHSRQTGAINPLLLKELENYPGYELPMDKQAAHVNSAKRPRHTAESESESSDDSMNPYD